MDTITTRDGKGTYTGTVIHLNRHDGWALVKIETAPASMQQWIGSQMEFPPSEIVETVTA